MLLTVLGYTSTSTTTKPAHRATADVTAVATKMLKKVMMEEKLRE